MPFVASGRVSRAPSTERRSEPGLRSNARPDRLDLMQAGWYQGLHHPPPAGGGSDVYIRLHTGAGRR